MIVVDSQGNEYEATYPKRAKGLVKSGRARFVAENKICLACPPNINLEDNKMSENINTNVEQKNAELTKSEVWAQIIKLQDQLASLSETMATIADIRDTHEYEGGEQTKCVEDAIVFEKLKTMEAVFNKREETLNSMLDFYKIVYNDLYQEQKNAKKEKIDTIKNLWLTYLDESSDVADEDGRIEIINYVQSQLSLLAIDIMDDKI